MMSKTFGKLFKFCRNSIGSREHCKVIAHRGSRSEGLPENSISAFIDAINHGADVIELDVWLSNDKQVVVHHDKDFSRMTASKCSSLVTSLTYKDFPELSPLNEEQTNRCHLYPKEFTTQVPLLNDVLDILTNSYKPRNKEIDMSAYISKREKTFCGNKDVCLIIEFKQRSWELINAVVALLQNKGTDFQSRVYCFSLDEKTNSMLRSVQSIQIKTITSIPEMLKVLLFYSIGLLPFVTFKDNVFGVSISEITLEQIRKESAVKSLPDFVKVFLSYLLAGKPPYLMNAPGLFRKFRSAGIPVWFLGVNNENDVNTTILSGATAALTDRPMWLIKHLEEKRITFSSVY